MKITFETDNVNDARSLLDALETRGVTVTPEVADAPDTRGATAPELDSNGMAWDAEIHTKTKTLNADGSWKASRGNAEKAKAAVAAFKAAGGNIEPPAVALVAGGGMPVAGGGMPVAGGGMPVARTTEDMPPPVTQSQLEEKIVGMLGRATLLQDPAAAVGQAAANSYQGLLDRFQIDRLDPSAALATNETLRSAVYTACCEIEPEV